MGRGQNVGTCRPLRRARTLFYRPGEVAEGIRQRNDHPGCFAACKGPGEWVRAVKGWDQGDQ